MVERRKLGEILVDLRVLKPAEVRRILEALQKRFDRQKFGQLARSLGLVREEDILVALAVQMELFPGIRKMSARQILQSLQACGEG